VEAVHARKLLGDEVAALAKRLLEPADESHHRGLRIIGVEAHAAQKPGKPRVGADGRGHALDRGTGALRRYADLARPELDGALRGDGAARTLDGVVELLVGARGL